MNTNQESGRSGFSKGQLLCLVWLLMIGMTVVGVTGFFRLSSDTAALRSSLQQSVGGQWNKIVTVHVGPLTFAIIRCGLRCVHQLPAEAHAAIEAVHGAEVGVYQLKLHGCFDSTKVFVNADKTMAKRGWDRAVGVAKEGEVVGVYVPHKKTSARNMKCCVMVLHDTTAVVVGARTDLRPLMAIATNRMDEALQNRPFACR